jgi:hypothetical protein
MRMNTDTVAVPARIVIVTVRVVAEPASEAQPMVVPAARSSQTCTNVATAHMCARHVRRRSGHAGASEMNCSNAASPDVRAAEVSATDLTAAHVQSTATAEMREAAAAAKMGSATTAEMRPAAATKMSTAATAAAAAGECIRGN